MRRKVDNLYSAAALLAFSTFVFAAIPISAPAEFVQSGGVQSGGGGSSSGSGYSSLQTVGETGTGRSYGGTIENLGGFVSTFLIAPGLDTDGDGVVDENDSDNDNDGLKDATELDGTAFNPTTPTEVLVADSDGDGTADGAEAGAGTNPRDANSQFRVIALQSLGGGISITWQSRGGRSYDVLSGTNLVALSEDPYVIETVTAAGGSAPWYDTTTTRIYANTNQTEFYRITTGIAP